MDHLQWMGANRMSPNSFLQKHSFLLQGLNWLTGVDYLWIDMIISAIWTLILMAPIHYKGSIGEQMMWC